LIDFVDVFAFVDGGTGRFVEASGGGVEVGVFDVVTNEIVLKMEGVIAYEASHRRDDRGNFAAPSTERRQQVAAASAAQECRYVRGYAGALRGLSAVCLPGSEVK
jgi:hypothetical protein